MTKRELSLEAAHLDILLAGETVKLDLYIEKADYYETNFSKKDLEKEVDRLLDELSLKII